MNGTIRIRRVYKATELKRFKELEGEYHHMGETHSGGDTMRVVFESGDGEWLALMVWGSAVYHLRPRDEYIGWNMALRAARQKLVVNNRRFTVLARPGTRPNLASQCLGLAMRELPRMWLKEFRLGLFGAHTLVRTWRRAEHLAGRLKGTTTEDVSYHASSLRIDESHGARFFGDCVRGEWRVEAYHARRDGAYCEDIRTRRCDENVTGALMLARTMALYFFSKSGMENCQAFKEEMQLNPDRVFDLVMGNET